ALILPWEFGAIPKAWLRSLRADEFWVPSKFVRDVLVRAGIASERVAVIPNGFDPTLYRPDGEKFKPDAARAVNFLFAGGAIARKGVDVLLEAWKEAFSPGDDVSLTVKDLGSKTFYRHLSLADEITQLASSGTAAPIIYLADEWSELRLPLLYRGSDVIVLPYRGEGFGLPLLEGLACGKPVIATGAGPAPEFCPPDATWFVPAEEVEVPAALRPPGEMTGPLTWFEPDRKALATALRAAYEEARRGRMAHRAAAAEAVRHTHTWTRVAPRYIERVGNLGGSQ
ncbi:MAG: glycosyltransferase family 4 protein, partial [Terriglobales bacterium]